MARVPLVFHEQYDLNFGQHVFPTQKYRMIRELLLRSGEVAEADIHTPETATEEELCLVHDEDWVRKLRKGTISYQEILKLEVPYSRRMVDAFWLAAGGSTLAGRLALVHGAAYNVGGGFHHAFPGHGEGFCAIHDVAVAIRVLQRERLIRKAIVVDVDVHQGNVTAAIFAGDDSVFTLSIHQLHNYPAVKPLRTSILTSKTEWATSNTSKSCATAWCRCSNSSARTCSSMLLERTRISTINWAG